MPSVRNFTVEGGGIARTQPKPTSRPVRPARSRRDDARLDQYFRRLDPSVAASFTEEQRQAIKTLLGARRVADHMVEIRRSVPFGRRRFYIVFLFGPERRTLARLYSEGKMSWSFNTLVYVALVLLTVAPAVGFLKLLGGI